MEKNLGNKISEEKEINSEALVGVNNEEEIAKVEAQSREELQIYEKAIEMLRTVYDPEIPVNVYDLGLIYKIDYEVSL